LTPACRSCWPSAWALESEAYLTKERSPYGLLAVLFIFSRIGYYLLGVRFDARPLLHYYQFIDPELLKHRLIESMYYLHVQPPGWNLYTGIALKLFPQSYPIAFHIANLVLGLVICWLTYYLMRVLGVSRWIAFALAAWFTVSPGVILFENFMLYEYAVSFLLVAAAASLWRYAADGSFHWLLLFFVLLLALVFFRNFFHLIYLVATVAALAYFFKSHRQRILLAGALPLLVVLGLYTKNWMLFGAFSGSTWLGMNMDTITAHQLTSREARDLVNRAVISPVSLLDLGSPIALYRPYIRMPALTGIPVLDECVTSTGATNFNCRAFFQVQRAYTRDGLALLRNYPIVYLRSLEAAWFTYFLPTGDLPSFDLNRPHIRAIDRLWNVVFFGQFEDASDRKQLRRLEAQGARASLVLHTGVFLMIGLPLLWMWGVTYLVRGVRRKTLDRPSAILMGFLLFNIAYLTAVANFLSSFENNRYRFPFDAFYVVLLGVALQQLIRRYGTATAASGVVAKTFPLPSNRSIT
jgi:Dolichyl-phosphate-mannose-protein mannosyltransferase